MEAYQNASEQYESDMEAYREKINTHLKRVRNATIALVASLTLFIGSLLFYYNRRTFTGQIYDVRGNSLKRKSLPRNRTKANLDDLRIDGLSGQARTNMYGIEVNGELVKSGFEIIKGVLYYSNNDRPDESELAKQCDSNLGNDGEEHGSNQDPDSEDHGIEFNF